MKSLRKKAHTIKLPRVPYIADAGELNLEGKNNDVQSKK